MEATAALRRRRELQQHQQSLQQQEQQLREQQRCVRQLQVQKQQRYHILEILQLQYMQQDKQQLHQQQKLDKAMKREEQRLNEAANIREQEAQLEQHVGSFRRDRMQLPADALVSLFPTASTCSAALSAASAVDGSGDAGLPPSIADTTATQITSPRRRTPKTHRVHISDFHIQ